MLVAAISVMAAMVTDLWILTVKLFLLCDIGV